MELKYLVVGTGRSGTVYMARFLTSLGILCGHESIFDYEGIETAKKRLSGNHSVNLSYASQTEFKSGQRTNLPRWLVDVKEIEADSSYMAVPFLEDDCLQNTTIIHVVRDPLKVIQSFCNYIEYFKSHLATNMYEQFIYTHLPELREEMSEYDRAALYYVRWNEMIERTKPDYFHKIEDKPDLLLSFLGKEGPYFTENSVNSYKRPCKEKFTLDKIQSTDIRDQLVAMGDRYGYKLEYFLF